MEYIEFLKSKIDIAPKTGIEISEEDVNPILKPHQRDAVIWAVRIALTYILWIKEYILCQF